MRRGQITRQVGQCRGGKYDYVAISVDPGNIFVIRASLPTPKIFHLNAKSPDALIVADRFPLKARDVVFVDAAGVVRWSRSINQIFPSISILNQAERFSQ